MRRLTGALLLTLALAACSSVGTQSQVASPRASASASQSPAASTATTAAFNLRRVDWRDAVYPGRACFSTRPIKLRDGAALIRDDRYGQPVRPGSNGPRYRQLALTEIYAYGDLQGAGKLDAVVGLWCNNNGGTADGAMLYSLAIFSGEGDKVHLLGLVTAQVQPRDGLPTLLSPVRVQPNRLLVREYWYHASDPTCCPSGTALTTWAWRQGRLSAGKPVIGKRR